uniref:Cytochrome c oxidase subunit 2 n=1 Tax=Polyplacotoma mediterranea TaxID=2283839 RepID=A0A481YJG8_9METZ|nr:cytochrome c oxidase subunit II [Polyplacotoma mediterranea]QBK82178.1 cytochrome c oxidase subunit II [Polyplacotoma mediterranea]
MINIIKGQILDANEPWQLGFQDAGSPVMEEIIMLHDKILFILTIIIGVVLWLIIRIVLSKWGAPSPHTYYWNKLDGSLIEIIWTIIPALILIIIAFPSLRLLYIMDETTIKPGITIKVVGHQWYWSYEYSDFPLEESPTFDSYMIPTTDLTLGDLRLLEVDNRLIVPVDTNVRVLITAADVIHSWTVPSLAVKMDAVPGRINETGLLIKRPGVFYGQCSEICGANHSFMPIVVEAVSLSKYTDWIVSFLEEARD